MNIMSNPRSIVVTQPAREGQLGDVECEADGLSLLGSSTVSLSVVISPDEERISPSSSPSDSSDELSEISGLADITFTFPFCSEI